MEVHRSLVFAVIAGEFDPPASRSLAVIRYTFRFSRHDSHIREIRFFPGIAPQGNTVLDVLAFQPIHDQAIAVDSAGELAGTGFSDAKDFPLVNAAWSTFDVKNNQSAFVVKLSADGSALVYSTLLSGAYGAAVAVDGPRNAVAVVVEKWGLLFFLAARRKVALDRA
jgi:hypothetical protein